MLTSFTPHHASTVIGWVRSADELEAWAGSRELVLGPELLVKWHHEDPDIDPRLGWSGGEPIAYGELWADREAGEAELARILVAPDHRGRGVGTRFVSQLSELARGRGFNEIWLRVIPTNVAAIACYRKAGFLRASSEEEAGFNAGQPRDYVWMSGG